jgi:hypothetical protein
MRLIEKLIRIEEYLNSWYNALPVTALHKLHDLEPDELYLLSEIAFEDKVFDLKHEWEGMGLIKRTHLHDKYEEEFSEFVSEIELDINKPFF